MQPIQARLRATGVVSIIMVMNLRRFIRDDDASAPRLERWGRSDTGAPDADLNRLTSRKRFEFLRGTNTLAAFLKQTLQPNTPFVRDDEEARVEVQGHELSVFRQYLIDNYFFPTYRLEDSTLAIVNPNLLTDPVLVAHLKEWTFKVRLTRSGMVVVKLERSVARVRFISISEMILETQRFLPGANAADGTQVPTQWQLAMDVVALFVRACGLQFVIPPQQNGNASKVLINLSADYAKDRLPLHDRHIVYLFSQIDDDNGPVPASDLKTHYPGQLVGLLENSLVLRQDAAFYPEYKPEAIATVLQNDLATWKNEICILTPETTLMCYPLIEHSTVAIGGGLRSASTSIYQDYWCSISRGIEHIVALKNEIQLIERETTRLLEQVPDIMRRVTDGALSKADRQRITNLATGIATLFRSLPQERDLLVPSSMFRWSAAYSKFQRLMQTLGIYEIERHIQTNVEELNAFLAHFNSIQIQYDAHNNSSRFALLTLLFSILVIPSCMADIFQILLNWDTIVQLLGNLVRTMPR